MPVTPISFAVRPAPASGRPAAVAAQAAAKSPPHPETATGPAVTEVTLELDVAVELGLRAKMETVTREEPEARPNPEEEAVAVYEDGEEEHDGEAVAALAHRLPRAVDRALHDAMKPLLRGRNGLDHESRAELREMRRELRHTLHREYRASLEGDDFDLSAFAGRAAEALESVASEFSSLTSSEIAPEGTEPGPAVPERLQFATERMSAMLERMIESLRALAPSEVEDEEGDDEPTPGKTIEPEIRVPEDSDPTLTEGIDLSV